MAALETSPGPYSVPIRTPHLSQLRRARVATIEWLLTARVQARRAPIRTLFGVGLAWLVLIGYFRVFGDFLAYSAARWLFDWSVEVGYGAGDWAPFYKCAVVVSAVGFMLGGFAATRVHRSAAAALLGFLLSLELAILVSVSVVAAGPTPVPHTWFYAIWLALPSAHRIGLLVTPLAVLVGGSIGANRCRRPRVPDADVNDR